MASKKKAKRVRNDYEDDSGISRPKKIPKTLVEKDSERRLIVILENASLETIKVSDIDRCTHALHITYIHRLCMCEMHNV